MIKRHILIRDMLDYRVMSNNMVYILGKKNDDFMSLLLW